MGVWNKRVVCTEEQEVIVQPNETMDGVVLLCREVAENGGFRVYLSFEEAEFLSEQIKGFCSDNDVISQKING